MCLRLKQHHALLAERVLGVLGDNTEGLETDGGRKLLGCALPVLTLAALVRCATLGPGWVGHAGEGTRVRAGGGEGRGAEGSEDIQIRAVAPTSRRARVYGLVVEQIR